MGVTKQALMAAVKAAVKVGKEAGLSPAEFMALFNEVTADKSNEDNALTKTNPEGWEPPSSEEKKQPPKVDAVTTHTR